MNRFLFAGVILIALSGCERPPSEKPREEISLQQPQQEEKPLPGNEPDPQPPAETKERIPPDLQKIVDDALAEDSSMEEILGVIMTPEFSRIMEAIEQPDRIPPDLRKRYEESEKIFKMLEEQGDNPLIAIKDPKVGRELLRYCVNDDADGFYRLFLRLADEAIARGALK